MKFKELFFVISSDLHLRIKEKSKETLVYNGSRDMLLHKNDRTVELIDRIMNSEILYISIFKDNIIDILIALPLCLDLSSSKQIEEKGKMFIYCDDLLSFESYLESFIFNNCGVFIEKDGVSYAPSVVNGNCIDIFNADGMIKRICRIYFYIECETNEQVRFKIFNECNINHIVDIASELFEIYKEGWNNYIENFSDHT